MTTSLRHREIRHLDGRKLASAGFMGRDDTWPWISETVAEEMECEPDDVRVLETDEGDVLTVNGIPAFLLC